MQLVNLTPHEITIQCDADTITFPPCGKVAKVVMVDNVDAHGVFAQDRWIPVNTPTYGDAIIPAIEDFGEPIGYIVSSVFAGAFRNQHPTSDAVLFVPDAGPSAIRENGQIKAVRRLIRK